MIHPPPCPICKSTSVYRTHYEGGKIIWFICHQCAHVFSEPPFAKTARLDWPSSRRSDA